MGAWICFSPPVVARGVFAEWNAFGFLFGVCDDAVWAVLKTLPGGQLRVRPNYPPPLIFKPMPMLVLLPATATLSKFHPWVYILYNILSNSNSS